MSEQNAIIETGFLPKRFVALDGWRGICALFIVLYHFNAVTHIRGTELMAGAYMFVDFFFVLSGFVIAASYLDKLRSGYPIKNYILLRLGRIYPLHLFALLLLVVFSFVKYYAEGAIPFSKETQSLGGLVASLFLVQGLGVFNHHVWNFPAWSISTEFYTYIIFAFFLMVFRKNHVVWLLLTIAGLTALLVGVQSEDLRRFMGLPGCLLGFLCGVLCYEFYRCYLQNWNSFPRWVYTLAEGLCMAMAALLLIYTAHTPMAALSPFVFSICLLVFTFEKGLFSKFFTSRPVETLGTLSYSIYMIHAFVQSCFYSGVRIAEKLTGWDLRTPATAKDMEPAIGDTVWQGDSITIIMVIAVLIAGTITYRFIEKPANDWIRRYVRKRGDGQRVVGKA